ncbi:ankyrin repeat domain-containing protein [Actinomadura oligospora]|uniref:ankyrin repeat domain-containing protein n=1 Tax=Actinomadura oligospora TaxID=111804 RepID=UPI00047DCEF9|nr:ankyrin repeat domain-containing protein [Actinomadura oligospora]
MQFVQAAESADETTMRSMLATDPGLADRHEDLVTRTAEARNWATVRVLVELGFDVNGVSAAGATALHHAAAAGELSIVRLLVEHGADHTVREPEFNAQPAGWAQYFKKPETRKYLESLA